MLRQKKEEKYDEDVSHYKSWNTGAVQIHVDPPPIPLIKININ